MIEHKPDPTAPGAPFRQPAAPPPLLGVGRGALGLGLLWLLVAGLFLLFAPSGEGAERGFDGLRFLSGVVGLFVPVAVILLGAALRHDIRGLRDDNARLAEMIERQRAASPAQQRSAPRSTAAAPAHPAPAARPASFSSSRRAPSAAQSAPPRNTDQEALPLSAGQGTSGPPLARAEFIRALNFPDTADDAEGFAVLRRAMRDRASAQMIQASQDVLTLLSQSGIYMDDLAPDRARPEVWRQFAQGIRGRAIAPMGGIRDRESLAEIAERMKQDAIFRDAVHHFLRLFDRSFAAFEQEADDADISALSDTRTARAFMLLGRVVGTFD
ncbi:hypothetical protein [Pontibaca methylaminivorans]|uniref:Uncharacterized protein n=1 Tax=Pontibaca methylaminivorans TaxID=515897 RepID=A0A1R3WTI1_9RHOB|nr:hypothetical protein [Pontibaca methylaminivorans]SIT80029.1 hypothetical protein SAMN05421849_1240 [Pontibaca methylaminivorans]